MQALIKIYLGRQVAMFVQKVSIVLLILLHLCRVQKAHIVLSLQLRKISTYVRTEPSALRRDLLVMVIVNRVLQACIVGLQVCQLRRANALQVIIVEEAAQWRLH